MKSGKQSATPAPRGPPSRGKTATSTGERERMGSPTSVGQSTMAHEDPIVDKKYKEKVFAQVIICYFRYYHVLLIHNHGNFYLLQVYNYDEILWKPF